MTTKKIILIFLLFLALLTTYFFLRNRTKIINYGHQESSSKTSSASNTSIESIYQLPKGKQVYNASHGKETKGPKMKNITFSPLSIRQNENQTIKVVFPEKENVGSIVLFVTTDNKENQKVTLTKDSKTNTWTGEWTPEDTIKSRYSVKIIAVGAAGEYNNTMKFL